MAYHGRSIVIIETLSGKTCERKIGLRELPETGSHLLFAHGRRHVIVTLEPERLGDVGIQVVEALHATLGQHSRNVLGGMREISVNHIFYSCFRGVTGVPGHVLIPSKLRHTQ